MATSTIGQLTLATSVVNDDLIEVEIAATGLSRRITRANFIGATLTGGGTIVTGGYTLTVPATGVASLLGTAQTYNAAKTFSALLTASLGITFGQNTLDHFSTGNWTPTGNNITFASAAGYYVRVGPLVYAPFSVTWPATANSDQANILGLPFVVRNVNPLYTFGGGVVSGADYTLAAVSNTTQIYLVQPGTVVTHPTNATMSGQQLRGFVIYLV